MIAVLKLNLYKLKNEKISYLATMLGIFLLMLVFIGVTKNSFYKDFEDTRMTIYLSLFAPVLLVIARYSSYISAEFNILQRDFYSGLNWMHYWIITSIFHAFLAFADALVYIFSLQIILSLLNIHHPHLNYVSFLIPLFLMFLCSHFLALFFSAASKTNTTLSIILSVTFGALQFAFASTIFQLPKGIKFMASLMYLNPAHRAVGILSNFTNLPSRYLAFHVPIGQSNIDVFKNINQNFNHDILSLILHLLTYFALFGLLVRLQFRKRKN